MATATFNPTANSGEIQCFDTTYANARAGTGSLEAAIPSDARIGQYLSGGTVYYCYQYFLEFDCSSIAGGTITAATLTLYDRFSDAATAFTIECRLNDHGSSLALADFVPGASLAAKTLLASRTTAGMSDPGDWTLTDAAMPANLTTGTNRMVVVSSRQTSNNTPTGSEYYTSYYDNSGGHPPVLSVTYTPGGGAVSGPAFTGGGFF